VIRAILLILGWLMAAFVLWLLLVALEVYWNLYNWQPKLDWRALGLGFAMCLVLAGIWMLAHATRQHAARGVSLVVCFALLALAAYVFPPEPLTVGLFARERSSPLWYRVARLAVLVLPTLFWIMNRLRQNNTACQPGASLNLAQAPAEHPIGRGQGDRGDNQERPEEMKKHS